MARSSSGGKAKNTVCVKASGWHGTKIEIYLLPGEHAYFAVDDRRECIHHRYRVFIYEDLEAAEQKRLELRIAEEENS